MRMNSTGFMLFIGSIAAVLLIIFRVFYSGSITFVFLIWNLFLAWVPVIFALLARRWRRIPLLALAAGFVWLLFLPNAPYLVTDLIHLRPRAAAPFWYDLITLFTFALLGTSSLKSVSLKNSHLGT